MNPLGSIELKTTELTDKLQFDYGYEAGWADLVAPPAAFLILLTIAWSTHHVILAAIIIAAFVAIVLYWLNITPARLTISSREVVSHGNHTRTIKGDLTIPSPDIESLRYLPSGNHGPAGLYASHGSKQSCLMPGVTPEQASALLRVIRRKYPQIDRTDQSVSMQFVPTPAVPQIE